MEFEKNFYIFEVLENYEDRLLCFENGNFYKGERFIGYIDTSFNKVVKSNMEEIVCIPQDKVRKVFKIKFEDIRISKN